MVGRIDCLQATYGRHSRVEESLACFLKFDYANRHLFILNAHQQPLVFDHPLVTIINEPNRHPTLGHCRNRLLEFAKGSHVVIYDDDDLWLPHFLSTAADRIGDAVAWKSTRSFWCDGPDKFALAANAMEASILWDVRFVRSIGGWYTGNGDESKTLMAALGNAGPKQDELHEWSLYLYRFGCGEWHASGTIGNGQPDEVRAADWRAHNNDTKLGGQLVPAFDRVQRVWIKLARSLAPAIQTPFLLAAMGYGPAHAASMRFNHGKVMTSYAAAHKFAGRRIVVAPGCWDVLHPGQIATLTEAKRHGDVLAVLVNDDAGVEVQKGKGRPLLPLPTRAGALSALACVDAVIPFHGADDGPTIKAVNAAAIVKGSDYSGKRIRNADLVPETIIAGQYPAFPHHTTDLIHAGH